MSTCNNNIHFIKEYNVSSNLAIPLNLMTMMIVCFFYIRIIYSCDIREFGFHIEISPKSLVCKEGFIHLHCPSPHSNYLKENKHS